MRRSGGAGKNQASKIKTVSKFGENDSAGGALGPGARETLSPSLPAARNTEHIEKAGLRWTWASIGTSNSGEGGIRTPETALNRLLP